MTPPVFAHGSLRLYLLSLLSERPQHGYELMQGLSDRFGGTYSPSAGTIYPRLAKLEEEGLVTRTADGRKTIYEITDAGLQELEDRRDELDAIEDEVTDSVRRLADEVRAGVNDAMRSLRAELASAARQAQHEAKRESKRESKQGKSETPQGRPSGWEDERVTARIALRDADLVVNEFRQQLRGDLRTHVARGSALGDATVSRLRQQLTQVRSDILSALHDS